MYVQKEDVLPPVTGTYETLSFAVIYNLALSWQLSGLAATNNEASRTEKLRKAMALYEHANRIMANGRVARDPLQYMATVCNMGVLYAYFHNEDRAAACEQMLLSAVMCCIDSGYNHPAWDSLLEGFLAKAMPMLLAPLAAAAA